MARAYMIRGTYGAYKTPCNVFVLDTGRGSWYAVEGSRNVNFTHAELSSGVDVESLPDVDYFHASRPIDDECDLESQVEE